MSIIDPIVPAAVKLAAKRAFVRTTLQAYAATLSAGISATVILGIIAGQVDLLTAAVQFGLAVVSPPIAGLAAWSNVTSNGIPKDYTDVALVRQAVNDPAEAAGDIETAMQRVSFHAGLH